MPMTANARPEPVGQSARRRQGGPPPLVPAVAYGVLVIAEAAVLSRGPRTGWSGAHVLRYVREHGGQLRLASLLIFASAVPLAIWVAVAYRRLRALGVTAPGAVIALVGGVLAAASIALSGLFTWALAESASSADAAVAHGLVVLAFACGAAGFVVPTALLVGGIAVPALLLRLTPRPIAIGGLVIAVVGMTSTGTLLTSALDPTLPIGRFGALAFMIAASLALPASRHEVPRPARGTAIARRRPSNPPR